MNLIEILTSNKRQAAEQPHHTVGPSSPDINDEAMSLISQNAISLKRDLKGNEEEGSDDEELVVQEEVNEDDDEEELAIKVVVGSESKKRKKQEEEREARSRKEMKSLESFVFGSLYAPVEFGKEDDEEEQQLRDDVLVFSKQPLLSNKEEVLIDEENRELVEVEINDKDDDDETSRKPAWVDDEEENIGNIDIGKFNRLRKLRKDEKETTLLGTDYVARLRAHYVKLNPGTDWAKAGFRLNNENDDDYSDVEAGDADSILRANDDIVVKSSVKLLPGILEYSRLVDANAEDTSNGPINSVQFHKNGQLLLAAGLDRRLRFFQIDGKRNTKIQSIFLEDCPIRKAAFLPDGSQVIAAGRRKFFYSFDLVKAKVDKIGPLTGREEKSLESFEVSPDSSTIAFVGNEGYILLVSTKSKELIGTLKMNGTVRSLAFTNDGQQLLSSGGDGHVYNWDLRTRKCIHKGIDEGCISGSSLCTSPSGALFAAGSSSGIVNVYNRGDFLGGKRKPIKTIENITTKVDFMKFNHDSQILAICSSMQKNSLKLVHVPTLTVFSNWPPPNSALHYPRCLDFSPGGGFMAFGNASGKVPLYKLHHYPHA